MQKLKTAIAFYIAGFALLMNIQASAQSSETYNLLWKVNPGDTITYKTTMKASVKSPEGEKSSSDKEDEFAKLAEAMAKAKSETSYNTLLFQCKANPEYLDIAMVETSTAVEGKKVDKFLAQMKEEANESPKEKRKRKKKKSAAEQEVDSVNIQDVMGSLWSLNDNIVLRGRISKGGRIVSTYYKNNQTNLIAVLFQLPDRPVKIGEQWHLNVSMIEMDQNFYCDNYINENKAFIEKIETEQGKQIAVVRYIVKERAEGDFNNPLAGMLGGTGDDGKLFMEVAHNGTGRFSITDGKWLSYEATMEIENNTGPFGGRNATLFKLEEVKK
jgi:hypothetical protein